MVAVQFQSGNQFARRHALAQKEDSVGNDLALICCQDHLSILLLNRSGLRDDHFDVADPREQLCRISRHLILLIDRNVSHLVRQFGQESGICFFLRGISHDHGFLAAVQGAIAGCAVADSSSQVLILARKRLSKADADRKDHTCCLNEFLVDLQAVIIAHSIDHRDFTVRDLDLHLSEMLLQFCGKFRTRYIRKSGVIADAVSLRDLVGDICTSDEKHALISHLRRDRR